MIEEKESIKFFRNNCSRFRFKSLGHVEICVGCVQRTDVMTLHQTVGLGPFYIM